MTPSSQAIEKLLKEFWSESGQFFIGFNSEDGEDRNVYLDSTDEEDREEINKWLRPRLKALQEEAVKAVMVEKKIIGSTKVRAPDYNQALSDISSKSKDYFGETTNPLTPKV